MRVSLARGTFRSEVSARSSNQSVVAFGGNGTAKAISLTHWSVNHHPILKVHVRNNASLPFLSLLACDAFKWGGEYLGVGYD